MADLPTGTVTFLFTDIEGSTRLWEQHPHAMAGALARHDQIMRQAIEAEAGMVYKVIGDAFQAAFTTAPAACAAALAALRALATEAWGVVGAVPVRMALHTCAAVPSDGDYRTGALNRLGRLLAAVHGGQIVLSRSTADLARETLPSDVTLRDMGERHLRDLRPEPVFQLVAPDLPTDFPPLKTLDRRPHNLPAQPTALIGREKEVASVCSLLRRADARLVTLSGPGGTGKTRLGLQVAAELLDDFKDGVWFVNLAPISDPNLVAATAAQTLGIKESAGRSLLDQLKDYLCEKQLLLLLDNFEQVADAAPLVSELLAAAPGLNVLATSRMPLHLSGEREYAVRPLGLPPAAVRTLERSNVSKFEVEISQYEAVQLFIERAQAVKADFAVTNANAPALAEICYQLDGLPLAIELAAARVKLFTPQALLTRLGSRLKLLTGGARDLPERQQTIRNTIDWSYQLLDEGEKKLFTRLGVFVGGCTLEAVEAVCNADGDLPMEIVDGIAALLDQSLVRQIEELEGEPRFRLLETIREYALERLAISGEAQMLLQQHAAYFLALAERAEPELEDTQQQAWLDQLEGEHDNLRAALAWSRTAAGHAALGLRLTGSLWRFWRIQGYLSEGRDWLAGLLALAQQDDDSSSGRGKALHGAGVLASYQGDYIVAHSLVEESLALFHKLGDKRGMAWSLNELGSVGQGQGNYATAIARYQESLTLFRELGDKRGIAEVLDNLGRAASIRGDYERAMTLSQESLIVFRELGDKRGVALSFKSLGTMAWLQGDYTTAYSLLEESLALFRKLGDNWGTALSLNHLGLVAREQGNYATARSLFEGSLALWRNLGNRRGIAFSLHDLGTVAHLQGDHRRATALFNESLALFHERENKWGIAKCLEGLARVTIGQSHWESAARLFGAAEAIHEAFGTHLEYPDHNRIQYDRTIAAIRAQLDEAAFAAAWATGRALTLEEAIAYTLEPIPELAAQPLPLPAPQPPTISETQPA